MNDYNVLYTPTAWQRLFQVLIYLFLFIWIYTASLIMLGFLRYSKELWRCLFKFYFHIMNSQNKCIEAHPSSTQNGHPSILLNSYLEFEVSSHLRTHTLLSVCIGVLKISKSLFAEFHIIIVTIVSINMCSFACQQL